MPASLNHEGLRRRNRRIRSFVFAAALLLVSICAMLAVPHVFADDHLDQSNDESTNGLPLNYAGQSFKAGKTGWLYDIELKMFRSSPGDPTINISIVQGESQYGGGTVLGSATLIKPNIQGFNHWIKIRFFEGVPVVAGQMYTIQVNSDLSTAVLWYCANYGSYSDGKLLNNNKWSNLSDTAFKTYVWETQQDFTTTLSVESKDVIYKDSNTVSAVLTNGGQPLVNEKVTFSVNGMPAGFGYTDLSGKASVNLSTNVQSGVYHVQAVYDGSSNYRGSSGSGSITVLPRPVTISANPATRMYGDANGSFNGTFSGLAAGDTPSSLGVVIFSTLANVTSPVGTYPIVPSGQIRNPNYTVTYINGTLNVTKAPLRATAAAKTRTYGEANPELTGSLTGLKNNDPITASYGTVATGTSPVGSYEIVPQLTGNAATLNNYDVIQTNGTLNVTPRPLMVKPKSVSRWIGYPNPELTGSVEGIIGSDGIEASFTASADEHSATGDYLITANMNDPLNRLTNYAVHRNNAYLRVYDSPQITYSAGDSADRVTGNVTLPDQDGAGVGIAWTSSDEQLLNPNTGEVKRPHYDDGDAAVELTAEVLANDTVYRKTYPLTIKATELTDLEAIERDKSALTITYAPGDRQDAVTQTLELPAAGTFGTTVHWTSSHPEVIDPSTGKVNRPTSGKGNVVVSLEAAISRGGEKTVRTFEVTVVHVPAAAQKLSFDKMSYELAVGQSKSPVLTVAYDDGKTYPVTTGAVLSVSNPEVLRIDSHGAVTGLIEGQTVLTAVYQGLSATSIVWVQRPIVVVPPDSNTNVSPGPGAGTGTGTGTGTTSTDKKEEKPELTLTVDFAGSDGSKHAVDINVDQAKKGLFVIQSSTDGGTFTLSNSVFEAIRLMNREGVFEFRTGNASFRLPIREMEEQASARSTLATVPTFQFHIAVGIADTRSGAPHDEALGETEWLSKLMRFDVSLTDETGAVIPITAFKRYVEQTISLGSRHVPDTATVVRWDERQKQYRFVPAHFATGNGQTTAVLQRKGTSLYAVVNSPVQFGDMRAHWARQEVTLLASKRILEGRAADSFDPNGTITRAEAAAMLVRALGLDDASGKSVFPDVKGNWYETIVQTAYQAGIIQGYADGKFRPEANVSREELAAMLIRAMRFTGIQATDTANDIHFTDKRQISSWALEAVNEAVELGFVQGDKQGAFRPGQLTTRAEMAVTVYRMLQRLKFI